MVSGLDILETMAKTEEKHSTLFLLLVLLLMPIYHWVFPFVVACSCQSIR